ncbi:hypothetical protein RKD37_001257 [Streptomyces ambofaciens]
MAEAQIILSHSRESGIVAIASGEQYPWAHTALTESSFQRDDDGVWHLPAGGTQITVVDLVACAKRHRTSVHTSSRRFIGDAARDLARLLPGQWHASVEIYAHPAWQEDLVPWIWDSGELGRALQSERILYAAGLTDAVQGTTLLFMERPGRQLDYLAGAFSPEGLEGGYGDPHAPCSIVLPSFPGRAAQALTDRYLPAYEQAVHPDGGHRRRARRHPLRARHLAGHERLRPLQRRHPAERCRPRRLDGAVPRPRLAPFPDRRRPRPDATRPVPTRGQPWPDDAAALSRLADAVNDVETLLDEIVHGGAVSDHERRACAWPAIVTWLTDGEAFLRQARLSAPHRHPALPVTAPARPLAAARSAYRSH